MGWCSATSIFDAAIEAAVNLVQDMQDAISPSMQQQALVNFAKAMRDELEDGDWDCQQESNYWDDFKWELWPKWAAEEKHYQELDKALINDY